MAAITQSNPHECLIRKVGYSVGLELLLKRVIDLVELYVREGNVSYVDWVHLVEEIWGRKPKEKPKKARKDKSKKEIPPYEHLADVYNSIKLINLVNKKIIVIYGLETLAILRKYFANDDDKFKKSTIFILLLYILENDGDIFLNCIAGNFQRNDVRKLLISMIEIKRAAIKASIKNVRVLEKIFNIVDIQSFSSNKGDKESPFKRRTTPLSGQPPLKPTEISDSQLDHTINPRKGWASDLELFEGKNISSSGKKMIEEFNLLKMQDNNTGSIQFWPYENALKKLMLNTDIMGIPKLNNWMIINSIAKTYGGILDDEVEELSKDDNEVLKTLHDLYRSNNPIRGLIRNQLPIYIAYPCFTAIKISNKEPYLNLPNIIEYEISKGQRRIDKTNIRGTEGGLVFRKK